MKKTLLTLLAFSGMLYAEGEGQEIVAITLPASMSAPTSWEQGKCPNNVEQWIANAKNMNAGFYVGGNNNSYGNPGESGEGTLTTVNNVASVVLCGRSGVGGDSFAFVLKDTNLVGKEFNGLTFSLSGTSTNTLTLGGSFALALVEGTKVVSSVTGTIDNVKTSTDVQTIYLGLGTPVEFTADTKVIAAFRGNGGSATTPYTISNISLQAIPEPATATLSLLALAGLAFRRRRH